MKVLSTSPDAAIRRLRGFAASIGGKAELMTPGEFNPSCLTASSEKPEKTLLLIDANSVDGAAILNLLPVEIPESVVIYVLLPDAERTIPSWASDKRVASCFVGGTLASLENESIRCAIGNFVQSGRAPSASTYLRWGYASSLWSSGRKLSIAEVTAEFMQKLKLPASCEAENLKFFEAALALVPSESLIVSGLIATDGINCIASVTLKSSNSILNNGLPRELAAIDRVSGTVIAIIHTPEIIELSLVRPVNGHTRGDGKSTIARPASFIKMINPHSIEDAVPIVRIVWTEAG